MNQLEATKKLEEILGRSIFATEAAKCSGNIETCKIDECMLCGVRNCPENEPLHYHHDGCPACVVRRASPPVEVTTFEE